MKMVVELHGGPRDGLKVTVTKGTIEYNIKGFGQDGMYVVKNGQWVWESNRGKQ